MVFVEGGLNVYVAQARMACEVRGGCGALPARRGILPVKTERDGVQYLQSG